jgi:hypothetical protein
MALPLLALLPALGALAPEIVKWVAGDKAGAVTGQVVAAVQAITGSDSPDALAAAIRDPQVAMQLRIRLAEIAAEAEKAERQAERDELLARLADVASARSQTVALAQAGSSIAWGAPVVSVLVTIVCGVACWLVLTQALPEGSQDIAMIVVGSLLAAFGAVVNFWLGSSHGSARKDEALRGLVGARK